MGNSLAVVFATDAPTASGHQYDDVLGKQYEFPVQYQSIVASGDHFLYYRGVRGSKHGRAAYFGAGIVGAIRSSSNVGQLVAELHDVSLFQNPVPAKSADGTYLETGSARGTNWSNGVRRVDTTVFDRVVDHAADTRLGAATSQVANHRGEEVAVFEYGVRAALDLLADRYGADTVHRMPAEYPGADIRVQGPASFWDVAVSATSLNEPVFRISEGVRQYAAARGAACRLIVVYAIDLSSGAHKIWETDGPLEHAALRLQPDTWMGRAPR